MSHKFNAYLGAGLFALSLTVLTASAHAQGSVSVLAQPVSAQTAAPLRVFGPGGPAPAMREAAAVFGQQHGLEVLVTAGPTPQWQDAAKVGAAMIYSGSEHMMSDFAQRFPELFDAQDALPLYLRPSAILVRKGNPKNIQGLSSLLQPGIKVISVAGAGQTGLWEDIAGRQGDIATVRALRRNMQLPEAANSAVAKQQWQDDASIDAWLIWSIWRIANPDLADMVAVEPAYRIYRDMGVVLTRAAQQRPEARAFFAFLQSPAGEAIFSKWGWLTKVDMAADTALDAAPQP